MRPCIMYIRCVCRQIALYFLSFTFIQTHTHTHTHTCFFNGNIERHTNAPYIHQCACCARMKGKNYVSISNDERCLFSTMGFSMLSVGICTLKWSYRWGSTANEIEIKTNIEFFFSLVILFSQSGGVNVHLPPHHEPLLQYAWVDGVVCFNNEYAWWIK